MHIAIITAGGAGMFCGSCMHDNTWARALMQAGHEVSLIPTYTPIRVDEHNESSHRVFVGGINVYLNSKSGLWRGLPRFMKSWLDRPGVIQMLTKRAISNDASELGELALSMLSGDSGPHRDAFEELDRYVSDALKPDVVIFSNALLSGAVRQLKERFSGPVLCVLQGDDVFLDGLNEKYRQQVINEVSQRAQDFDGFLTHSQFYRDYMSKYLSLPIEKFSALPLGIDFTGHHGLPELRQTAPYTIGYFARVAPEKGVHHLVNGFVELRRIIPDAQLKVGGFLGPQFQKYLNDAFASAGEHASAIEYIGSPQTHKEKVEFLNSVDVLSVPTEFLEPKGIYVLEALANGVPVVQPRHGSFPEIIEATEGGLLVTPKDPTALAEGLAELHESSRRIKFAKRGWEQVRSAYSPEAMAARTTEILEQAMSTKSE
ncbi:glycosyltransferase family 4 protein [Thalassoglobus polymorphus]|nr:glycosyltransferase family 4 protein [Thalassoglobus polymorphus]